MGYGVCMCTCGPPPGGVCNACGMAGVGYQPSHTAPMQLGWKCPTCGAGNAPWAATCGECRRVKSRGGIVGDIRASLRSA